MRTPSPAQLGLAAVVLFAPGGFILGATLAANHVRKRIAERRAAASPAA